MSRTISAAVFSVVTAGVFVLAGCSSAGDNSTSGPAVNSSDAASATGTPASGPHNAADVTFATDMIPHHAQAVEMADMALAQATSTEVKGLATQIKNAQDPEIQTMSGWLTGWGEMVPTGSMSGMDHSMGSGTGMMSDTDMAALGAATGAAFDRMWVTMMIQHHTGALEMATTELASGQSTDAKTLAQSIVTSQTAEIATMKQLLTTLPSS